MTGTPLVPKPAVFMLKPNRCLISFRSDRPACYVLIASPHFCVNTLFGTPSGTTIVIAAHNNRNILIVPYKDIADEDKDVIGKAIEEF